MDLATLLTKVDRREIPTAKAFLDAAALIPAGEQQFWGGDPEGVREVRSAAQRSACPSSAMQGCMRLKSSCQLCFGRDPVSKMFCGISESVC